MTPRSSPFASTRRAWLRRTSAGFGAMALHGLLHAASIPLAVRAPMIQPRARRVIFLFMAGGPSQMDLFDPKPLIQEKHGKSVNAPLPEQHRHESTEGLLALGTPVPADLRAWLMGNAAVSDEFFALLSPLDYVPGVFAVLTADDVPDVRFGPFVQDRTLFARDVVRFEGEVLAAVAAAWALDIAPLLIRAGLKNYGLKPAQTTQSMTTSTPV